MCMFTCKRKKIKENRLRNIKHVQNESHALRLSLFPSNPFFLSIQCDELAANYLRGTFEGLRQTFCFARSELPAFQEAHIKHFKFVKGIKRP